MVQITKGLVEDMFQIYRAILSPQEYSEFSDRFHRDAIQPEHGNRWDGLPKETLVNGKIEFLYSSLLPSLRQIYKEKVVLSGTRIEEHKKKLQKILMENPSLEYILN